MNFLKQLFEDIVELLDPAMNITDDDDLSDKKVSCISYPMKVCTTKSNFN